MCLSVSRGRHDRSSRRRSLIGRSTNVDGQQRAPQGVLRLLIDTTTLMAPTHNGHHRRRSLIASRSLGTPHPESPVLQLGNATLAHLEKIFQDLCYLAPTFYNPLRFPAALKTSPTLSRERLQRFLISVQGETITAPLAKDRYRFEDFLEVLYYRYSWDAVRPPPPQDILDLTQPISHYFISSSHNTYLVGNQLSSEASVAEYEKVLQNGCRCIEIDVWNPPAKSRRQSLSRSPHGSVHRRHRRYLSSSSVAASLHENLEAVASRIAARISFSHSRASSFSQTSLKMPSFSEQTTAGTGVNLAVEPQDRNMDTKTLGFATVVRANVPSSVLDSESAIDDNDSDDEDDGAKKARRPMQLSEKTTETAVAKISVTAPDAETTVPAEASCSDTDAAPDQEPVVMHAHNLLNADWTLGTSVPFRAVCQAVRKTAFLNSSLPVIVSLEVHTNPEQQRKMVQIMKEEWGDLLLDCPLDGIDPQQGLPTLEHLMGKILVKVKKPDSPVAAASAGHPGSNGSSSATTNAGPQTPSLGTAPSVLAAPETTTPEDNVLGAQAAASPSSKNARITEELGRLAVYTESRHFNNFHDPEAKTPTHIFSLSETAIQTLHEKQHEHLLHHNRTYMMRAYPNAAKHVLSTNPDPACCWRRGVQMVALNWQTLDKAMMLNHAMFSGSQGWVRKPDGIRAAASGVAAAPATPTTKSEKDMSDETSTLMAIPTATEDIRQCPVATALPVHTLDLCITVLAGQHLPLPPALRKKTDKKAGNDDSDGSSKGPARWAAATGIVTGRAHFGFRPVVKFELNVERPEERCPEAPEAIAMPAATGSTLASGKVKMPEAVLKQKTAVSQSDHPDWGTSGDTLRFMNVAGIVESLSFVLISVEDEGSKTAQERAKHPFGFNRTLAGWACIRLDRLQTGYRFVQLMDGRGQATEGQLLVRIDKLLR